MRKVFLVFLLFVVVFAPIKLLAKDLIILDSSSTLINSEIKKSAVKKFYSSKQLFLNKDSTVKVKEIFFLDFDFGIANALNEFGSKDLTKETSGLAKNGFVFNGSLILNLASNIGFIASYRYQQNKIEDELFADNLNAIYNVKNFKSSSTPWIIKGWFGGLYFNFPVKFIDKLYISVNLSAGLPKFVSPKLDVFLDPYNASMKVTQNSSESNATTYACALGLNYKTSSDIGLNFRIDYLQSKVNFSNVKITAGNGPPSYSNFEQKISSLSLKLGLTFLMATTTKK